MKKLTFAGLVLGLFVALALPAAAQGPSISTDPSAVTEAGEAEITVTGTGFTQDGFLLPCPGANADPAQLAEDSCDLTNLTPYTAGDWELTVTYDIPAEGLLIVAGSADQSEVVPLVIPVGEVAQAELPNTGGNTETLLVVALALLAAAGAFVVGGRRLQHA
ncbi:MAG: LPXTG cell wall anchor domain-containing protein [Actinomycetota bacterium]